MKTLLVCHQRLFMQVKFGRLPTFAKKAGFIAFSFSHRSAASVASLRDGVMVVGGATRGELVSFPSNLALPLPGLVEA